MRYGIFSDIHSNLEALESVIDAFKSESIDTYLCIGDIVGYAANPGECIDITKDLANITVAGNHDWAVVSRFSTEYFNDWAKVAIIWTQNKINFIQRHFLASLSLVYENEDLILAHGSLNSPQEFNYMTDIFTIQETLQLMQKPICFIGHTHSAGILVEDTNARINYHPSAKVNISPGHKYIVNVGSVGQPRDGNPQASFCVYDTEKKEVSIRRINYDIESAQKKILACRLPRFLADRLKVGK